MANIAVYFKLITLFGIATPYYHEFLVYTDDSGNEYFARGGPAGGTQYSLDSGGESGGSSSNPPFGNIVTQTGAYQPGTAA